MRSRFDTTIPVQQYHTCNKEAMPTAVLHPVVFPLLMRMMTYASQQRNTHARTSVGFRRITTNCSARCIKKLVNLWHRIVSISSACFTAMLTRTLLTLVSMRHRSCSFRQIVTGLSRSSLLDLRVGRNEGSTYTRHTSSQNWRIAPHETIYNFFL